MPSTPSPIGRTERQALGENVNTWGHDKLNATLNQIEDMASGVASVTVDSNVTLSNTNFVDNQSRHKGLIFTGAGGYTVTLPGGQQGIWFIANTCSSDVTVEVGAAGNSQIVRAGRRQLLMTDGTTLYKSEDGASKEYVDGLAFQAADLPGQAGNAGNFLTTDGSTSSWYDLSLDYQIADATLNAVAGVTTAADRFIYFTGSDVATTGTVTAFGRTLLDDANAAAARLSLELGSAAQANISSFGDTLINTADAPAALTALGAPASVQTLFGPTPTVHSGSISVNQNTVGRIPTPDPGGFIFLLHNTGVYPQIDSYVIAAFDTGLSLSLGPIMLGSQVQDGGITNLTGTTGNNGFHTIAVQPGEFLIENRLFAAVTFKYFFMC